MTDLHAILNSVGVAASLMGIFWLAAVKITRIEVKVDTMWMFQLRRGLVELEAKGLGAINSPMKLTAAATALLLPILPELKSFYQEIGGDKADLVELAEGIERQFGPRLINSVCRKVGVNDAACLVLAIGMLRPIGPQMLPDPQPAATHCP